VTSLALLSVPA